MVQMDKKSQVNAGDLHTVSHNQDGEEIKIALVPQDAHQLESTNGDQHLMNITREEEDSNKKWELVPDILYKPKDNWLSLSPMMSKDTSSIRR